MQNEIFTLMIFLYHFISQVVWAACLLSFYFGCFPTPNNPHDFPRGEKEPEVIF